MAVTSDMPGKYIRQLHEPDPNDPTRAACASGDDRGYDIGPPGGSTCGQAACRELRALRNGGVKFTPIVFRKERKP